jgi:hypothetical protein
VSIFSIFFPGGHLLQAVEGDVGVLGGDFAEAGKKS